jgi:hypothetical protein
VKVADKKRKVKKREKSSFFGVFAKIHNKVPSKRFCSLFLLTFLLTKKTSKNVSRNTLSKQILLAFVCSHIYSFGNGDSIDSCEND